MSGEWLLWPPLQAVFLPPPQQTAPLDKQADPIREWPLPYAYHLWRLVAGPIDLVSSTNTASGRAGLTAPVLRLPRLAVNQAAAGTAIEGAKTTGPAAVATTPSADAPYSGCIQCIDLEPLRSRLRQPIEPLPW